ncbi:hypothetical protein ACJJTC_004150, partial [Scirpophaga incertulas]
SLQECSHNLDGDILRLLRLVTAGVQSRLGWRQTSVTEVSFEKCSFRPRSSPEKCFGGGMESKPYMENVDSEFPRSYQVSAASPRRIIRAGDRSACIRAELDKGRRQSLDALFHDTGEKVKEMFQ